MSAMEGGEHESKDHKRLSAVKRNNSIHYVNRIDEQIKSKTVEIAKRKSNLALIKQSLQQSGKNSDPGEATPKVSEGKDKSKKYQRPANVQD